MSSIGELWLVFFSAIKLYVIVSRIAYQSPLVFVNLTMIQGDIANDLIEPFCDGSHVD